MKIPANVDGGISIIWLYIALLAIGIAAHFGFRRWSKSRERPIEKKVKYAKRLEARLADRRDSSRLGRGKRKN